ncbi:hypothetical protein SAMN05421827_105201 [Pedobacter terrae]|uniref:Uncharacterized protein n=1 Tax=Pedobacter terrae TaxID=405671 RepID=A0A1G7TFL9_9SPHI|nr:hypothetical protein SAMN05421827_105201 [Pedobacter terrae]
MQNNLRLASVVTNRRHKKAPLILKPMAQQIIGGLSSYLDKEYTLVTFVLSILAVNSNLFAVILFILQ